MKTPQTERHVGEAADVREPEVTEMAGNRSDQAEVQSLDRGALPAHLFNVVERAVLAAGEHDPRELLDPLPIGCRAQRSARPNAQRNEPLRTEWGLMLGERQAGHDLEPDQLLEQARVGGPGASAVSLPVDAGLCPRTQLD